jgi:hypothetical protein
MKVVDFFSIGKQLLRLLRRAPVGDKPIVARAGLPTAHLLSLTWREPRRPGLAAGRLTDAFFDPLPTDELAAWEQ